VYIMRGETKYHVFFAYFAHTDSKHSGSKVAVTSDINCGAVTAVQSKPILLAVIMSLLVINWSLL